MQIPVFHDDQHGTAIISGAALINGAELAGKKLADMKVVVSGAGASAIACANFYVELGVRLRERHAGRLAGRHLRGPRRGHEPLQGEVRAQGRRRAARAPTRCAAPTCSWACRRRGCARAEMLKTMAKKPIDLRAGQPRSGDQLPRREGGAPRRDRRDRAQRLPQPGQQRARVPLHLPRRARRARARRSTRR